MKTVVKKKLRDPGTRDKDFSVVGAIVIVILLLTFLSSSIYIMMSSLP
jgi:hypothetical protein